MRSANNQQLTTNNLCASASLRYDLRPATIASPDTARIVPCPGVEWLHAPQDVWRAWGERMARLVVCLVRPGLAGCTLLQYQRDAGRGARRSRSPGRSPRGAGGGAGAVGSCHLRTVRARRRSPSPPCWCSAPGSARLTPAPKPSARHLRSPARRPRQRRPVAIECTTRARWCHWTWPARASGGARRDRSPLGGGAAGSLAGGLGSPHCRGQRHGSQGTGLLPRTAPYSSPKK